MNAHTRKTYEAITEGRAPRALEWTEFVTFWNDVADDVERESGDRLVVHLNGRREVFRRQHDGRVSLEDIERARHLLAETPPARDTGEIVVVAIDDEQARIITYELGDGPTTERQSRTIHDTEPTARRLRTVERRRGRDDVHDLTGFFDDVATELVSFPAELPLVVLGAGHGKSAAAEGFAQRLRTHHSVLRDRLRGVGRIDLSAATDTDLEAAALAVLEDD
ncbi:hypothetical protein ACSMXN_05755 [Jatrophihabitans sp. DSM 45814]